MGCLLSFFMIGIKNFDICLIFQIVFRFGVFICNNKTPEGIFFDDVINDETAVPTGWREIKKN